LLKARRLLKKGMIIAVKGIGGYHIAVDAANARAVARLKNRKKRSNKPLAVMADCLKTVRRYAIVDKSAERLLTGPEASIVILRNRGRSQVVSNAAPGLVHTGWYLPYAPLHYLLFDQKLQTLIMTSANVSEEPIQFDNKESKKALKGMVDFYLMHDRNINIPADDSVLKYDVDKTVIIRRSRGFVPVPVSFKKTQPDILSTGALLKNSICVIRKNQAYMSQHIGDLENKKAYDYFMDTVNNFLKFYGVRPKAIACDLHPDYLSSIFAQDFSHKKQIPQVKVQHHFAHMLSVMAEHAHEGRVLGVIMDGTGYGEDGHTWGGEFLAGGLDGYRRLGHLRYVRLPGGDKSSRQGFRTAISLLQGRVKDSELKAYYRQFEAGAVLDMLKKGINTPLSSGAGRLFDAASSVLGICHESTYDAEAPMKLEAAATGQKPDSVYDYSIGRDLGADIIDLSPAFLCLWNDRKNKKAPVNFHNTFADAICMEAEKLAGQEKLEDIVLAGGVFQNTVLLDMTLNRLQKNGFNVLIHEKMAANDASIALGQAVYAAYKLSS
jgi:hydrogenase maturation protein HypF